MPGCKTKAAGLPGKRRRAAAWLAAGALILGAAGSACAPEASPGGQGVPGIPSVPAKKGATMTTAPLELRLAATPGPGLRAELVNLSGKPQPYLHDSFHQPCALTLKRVDGKAISSFDSRAIGKRSNALEEDMYATAGPGETDTLLDESFVESEGTYELHWGPYRFKGLRPGKYRAVATWKSAKDTWHDAESEKSGRVPGLWKGILKSREVELELPPEP